MSQHDLTIDNQGFPSFRSDLNNALQALGTLSSGSTEPSTTFAYQFWADTTNDLLKQRNSANTDWVDILTLSTGEPAGLGSSIQAYSATLADLVSKSGTYTALKSGRKNAIINGNFDVWQRGTGAWTSAGYTADRWYLTPGNNTVSLSRGTFTLGQTDVPNEPKYYLSTSVTTASASNAYAIVRQPVEDVRTFAGQTVTLSFYAKADAAKDICVEFVQNFGTGGSPSASVEGIDSTTVSLTTSWAKYEVQVSVPSISGKTLGTADNSSLMCYFWLEAGSDYNSRTNSLGNQSGTFDIAQVQLEAGSVATDFERRSYGEELALCQRYFQTSFPDGDDIGVGGLSIYDTNAYLHVDGTGFGSVSLPVTMRANPSVSVYAPITASSSGNLRRHYDGAIHSATSSTNTRESLNITVSTGTNVMYQFGYTADAEL